LRNDNQQFEEKLAALMAMVDRSISTTHHDKRRMHDIASAL